MKKFIPYILIAVMMGIFLWVFFVGPFSGTMSGPKKVLASEGHWYSGYWCDPILDACYKYGKDIWEDPNRLNPGYVLAENLAAWGDWGNIADATIGEMLAWIASFIWSLSSKLFTFSGYLLDYAVDFSVRDFKEHIDQIEVINTGYKIILNVANMLFIFILLYIAIKTILGMGGNTKKLLINIIVVGLFINFSLFMTKTIIDASNIVAMAFLNGVEAEAGATENTETGKEQKLISQGSVATSMMAGLKLQTVIPSSGSEYNEEDPTKGMTNFNIAINYLGGSVLFLISAFVFLSVALLFLVRFVALLFYMIFSPIAFLGLISPELKEYSGKWWKGLQSQALFAPAFLFMAYLISAIVNSGQLWKAVGGDKDPSSSFYEVISATGTVGGFGIIMNYAILTALMIGALTTAKSMAGKGSAGITKYTDKFQGWAQGVAGRNTIGRVAYIASRSDTINKLTTKFPTVGGFAKTRLDSVAGATFGGDKGGYTKTLKDKIKQQTEIAKGLNENKGKNVIQKEKEIKDLQDLVSRRKNIGLSSQDKLVQNAKNKYRELEAERVELEEKYDKGGYEEDKLKLEQKETEVKQAKEELENRQSSLNSMKNSIKNDDETLLKAKTDLIGIKDRKLIYAKNLEFGSSVLNKLFPSGASAAAEIRKGKSKGEKEVADLIEKLVEEKSKEKGIGATSDGGKGGSGGKTS